MRWHESSSDSGPAMPRRKNVRRAAALTMVVAAGLVIWLLLDDSGSDEETASRSPSNGAEVVSVATLQKTAAQGTPIYWAGPPSGSELELSRPSPGRTYVRYLTGEAEAGDSRPFLTVGSYLLPDPVAALRKLGNQPDGVLATAPRNGTVYFNRQSPTSIYLAYPGEQVEIEVFVPNFEQALQLVTSGRIVPVE
jgi:hypothetical protein